MLYKIIYKLIHNLIGLYFIVLLQLRNFQSFLYHYYLKLLPIFIKLPTSVWSRNLKKLPSHLGIIICEDAVSFNDISNLILWSACVGIRYVSVFDRKGFVKTSGKELYEKICVQKELILKKEAHKFNIIFTNGKSQYKFNKIIRNGQKKEDVLVYLLSPEDGKEQIVNAARSVCKDARTISKLMENFHEQHFTEYLNGEISIPDPELLTIFGKTTGLIGYLPWHTRLSEMIFQPTHLNFSLQDFHDVLLKYNKCEQRFGK